MCDSTSRNWSGVTQLAPGGAVSGSFTKLPAITTVTPEVCAPEADDVLTPSSWKVLGGVFTEAIWWVPLAALWAASAPDTTTVWPLWNWPIAVDATVTTAGLSVDRLVAATGALSARSSPSQLHTPSMPLAITVYFDWPRLANEVQCQSSEPKPVLRSSPVSASASFLLVPANSFGLGP